MTKAFFASDFHLGQRFFIHKGLRNFSSIEEMNEIIIDRAWSLPIGSNLYFAGDIGHDKDTLQDFFCRKPKGIHFHWILGNHDRTIQYKRWANYCESISDIKDIKINDIRLSICHFPMISWNKSHYGSWHIHGHLHTNSSNIVRGKAMNVCVDVNDFKMISFDEVVAYMKTREDNWDLIKESCK